MLHKTRGIILHKIKYSETSVICKVFTRDLGLQSYLVNGVRSSKSPAKASLFRPLGILDMVVYRKDRQGLQRMKESSNGYVYRSLPFDIIKSSIGLFMIEVLNKALTDEEPHPELYDFIEQSFTELDEQGITDNNYHLYFMLRLSRYLGFAPGGEYSNEHPYFDLKEGSFVRATYPDSQYQAEQPYSEYISLLLEEQAPVTLTNSERSHVLDYLLKYFTFHLQGFGNIRSHRILHDVLEG